MEDRENTKNKELQYLVNESGKNPKLFKREGWVDDDKTLRRLGIRIPKKDDLPLGFIKFLPEDFIVEEILNSGEICNITYENLITEETLIEPAPTIYATLVKCGISTIEAIEDISHQLNCDIKSIQYSGIKDKDAITAQRISFRNVPAEKIKKIKSAYFFIKDAEGGKGVAERGNILGNKFTILVRTTDSFLLENTRRQFLENFEKISKDGFYNFYYLQRFGTPRLNNFHWALEIIKGNYEEAVKSFLTYQGERELAYFREMRKVIKNHFGDWQKIKEIVSLFPIIEKNENRIIDHLLKNPKDFSGAINTIPDQITLWIYALSSWLFNSKISNLIENNRPVPSYLPLFLSKDSRDWMVYKELLADLNILPPPFENLKSLNFIQLQHREVRTKEMIKVNGAGVLNEGIVLSFDLKTGEYATTFLAHLFNLISGKPPENLNESEIDIKKSLGDNSAGGTIKYFRPIIHSKAEDILSATLPTSNS